MKNKTKNLRLSLRKKMTLMIGFSFLVLLATGMFLGYGWGKALLIRTILHHFSLLAETTRHTMDVAMESQIKDIGNIFKDHLWISDIEKINRSLPDAFGSISGTETESSVFLRHSTSESTGHKLFFSEDFSAELKKLLAYYDKIVAIDLASLNGIITASTRSPESFYVNQSTWWQKSYADGKGEVYISNTRRNKDDNLIVTDYCYPIYNNDGALISIARTVVSMSSYFDIINGIKFGKTGHVAILTNDAKIIFSEHHNEDDIRREVKGKDIGDIEEAIALLHPLDEIISASSGFRSKHIKDLNWNLVIYQNKKDVFAPLASLSRHMALLFFILLALVFILSFYCSKFFSAPIKRLRNTIKSIMEGEKNTKVLIKTGDELETLGEAFNEMMANLQNEIDSKKKLSDEIELRSKMEKELKLANKDLESNEDALKNILYDLQKTHDEMNNMQSKMVQSEKMASLGQLSAGVAHEINNPLGFIDNNLVILEEYMEAYSELLRAMERLKLYVKDNDLKSAQGLVKDIEELEEQINIGHINSDIEDLIRQSKSGTERIKCIISDLRMFARKDDEEMVEDNLENIIDRIVNIVWNEIKYNAELNKDYGQIPPVKCNPQKLGQVFMNLVVNAAHSLADKGYITIKTYVHEGKACVDVSDTGQGIAKENISKIFDPFFTTKEPGKGTGLGLSISYDIVKKHGGEIKVSSEPGAGTCFTVVLPLADGKNKTEG